MVYTERAETAAVSRGTSHAATTRYRWIFKNALKNASHSRRITCQRNESARERGIALYKSDQQQQLFQERTAHPVLFLSIRQLSRFLFTHPELEPASILAYRINICQEAFHASAIRATALNTARCQSADFRQFLNYHPVNSLTFSSSTFFI